MKYRLFILCSLFLLLCATVVPAHAAPPSLTVSTAQRDATAQLLIGTFDAPPTTLEITLPSGWTGAPATVVMSGTALLTFALVRGPGASQLGVVRVEGGGLAGHAYLAGPTIASVPPRRAGRVLLPMVRR